jgi:integrase
MAILLRDTKLDSRAARRRLAPRREPYWRKIARDRHFGYRRSAEGGTWIARYRDLAQLRHYKALGPADDVLDADGTAILNFDQAQLRAREWFSQLDRDGVENRKAGAYTIADCMNDYLDWVRRHRKSHHHLKTYCRAYILPRLGSIDTAKLTTAIIRKWHHQLASEPPRLRRRKGGQQTYRTEDPDIAEAERKRRLRANHHLTTLRAALNRAWREGLIAHNDAWTRIEPFRHVEQPRSRFLNHDEARRLINACPPDLRRLVQLALLTGARFGELCAFDVRDFQSDSGTLFVRDSKSGKSRHIILNAEGAQLCRELVLGRVADASLITKADGSRWQRDHQFRPFKTAVKAAQLDPTFTFHGLRHTWASLTVMAGAPLIVVAHNLGHRDTRMVERHYGHLAAGYVSETIQRTAPSFGIIADTKILPLTR